MSLDVPKVTVTMPVYNGERYLGQAIESILNQTFRDFEFIIIDDGSTDGTAGILAHYQQIDSRIHVYLQENQGVTASRNRGCHLALGKYIAVMDADDISLPERLAREVNYLDEHPEVGVLGTCTEQIDESGKRTQNRRMPTTPSLVGWCLIFGNCLEHSSVMMRRDVVEQLGFYRTELRLAEDYDLWSRASLVTRVANIPEILVRYRVWEGGTTSRRLLEMEQYAARVSHSMIIRLLGPAVSSGEEVTMQPVSNLLPLGDSKQIDKMATLVKRLYRAYLDTHSLNRAETREVARDAGIRLLALAASPGEIALVKRLRIVAQAITLSPYLLWSKQVIAKGAERSFRMLFRRV